MPFQPDTNSVLTKFSRARPEFKGSEAVNKRIGWDRQHANYAILDEYMRLGLVLLHATSVISKHKSFPQNGFAYPPDLIAIALTPRFLWQILRPREARFLSGFSRRIRLAGPRLSARACPRIGKNEQGGEHAQSFAFGGCCC